jgi:hypothetical protein
MKKSSGFMVECLMSEKLDCWVSGYYPPCCQHFPLDLEFLEHLEPFLVIAVHCPETAGLDFFDGVGEIVCR